MEIFTYLIFISYCKEVKIVVQKRFPADTAITEETRFLCDKNLDAELYAFLQSISFPVEGVTKVDKKAMPSQAKICEKISVKSPKTYRAHLKYLIETGYVIEEDDAYILPDMEDIYLLLPLDTLHFILDTVTESVIKVYIYLGQRYKYKHDYVFTQEEIAQHLGVRLEGKPETRRQIKNALIALQNHGLIQYETFYDGKSHRYRLLNWSSNFVER